MNKILIDTDVILDFFFDREPFSNQATSIFNLCEKRLVLGFITPVTVSNVYYLLRKTAKHEKVVESLKMLMSIMDISTVNKESLLEALNSDFKDFEDAIQNFSAQFENDIKIIVTRNIKDYKASSLSIMTPDAYLMFIEIRK
jgi:predicted nucleic acid-binding protein